MNKADKMYFEIVFNGNCSKKPEIACNVHSVERNRLPVYCLIGFRFVIFYLFFLFPLWDSINLALCGCGERRKPHRKKLFEIEMKLCARVQEMTTAKSTHQVLAESNVISCTIYTVQN